METRLEIWCTNCGEELEYIDQECPMCGHFDSDYEEVEIED